MLVVMVTSLSEGGVASLIPRSFVTAAASACSPSPSETFRQSFTHLQ